MLTNKSQQLQTFIDKSLSKYSRIQNTVLTIPSSLLLKLIVIRIHIASALWNINSNYILSKIDTVPSAGINREIYDASPSIIRDYIQNKDTAVSSLQFALDDSIVQLHIYHYNTKNINNIVRLAYIWFDVVRKYGNTTCSKNITLHLFLTDMNKTIPTSNNGIDREHINSAYTYPCRNNNYIVIYRKEDWFKTLIHESFHYFGLDFSGYGDTITNEHLNSYFNTNNDYKLCECYAETWATIINCLFVSFYSVNLIPSFNAHFKQVLHVFSRCMKNEICFATYQCYKIFNKLNIVAEKERVTVPNEYTEQTPILSYHFFKLVMISNFPTFIQWCSNNSRSIRFDDRNVNVNSSLFSFVELILMHIEDPILLQNIRSKQNIVADGPLFLRNTLRMVSYEMR